MNTFIISVVMAAIAPLLYPVIRDLFVNVYIYCMNKHRGKPTWVVGTVIENMVLMNGFSVGRCKIYKTDFSTVYFRYLKENKAGTFVQTFCIKKRDMQKLFLVYPAGHGL